jgi:psiF repeat
MKQLITALALTIAASASFAASHAAAAPAAPATPAKPAAPATAAVPAAPATPAKPAAMPEKKATPQQEKMANCNKDAADKKGDERKAFMKTCLSGKPAAMAGNPACEKSADDKKLAGAARNSHVKKCMADGKKG